MLSGYVSLVQAIYGYIRLGKVGQEMSVLVR